MLNKIWANNVQKWIKSIYLKIHWRDWLWACQKEYTLCDEGCVQVVIYANRSALFEMLSNIVLYSFSKKYIYYKNSVDYTMVWYIIGVDGWH